MTGPRYQTRKDARNMIVPRAFLPDSDAAARGKNLLAGGIWSSCHRFRCFCRLLSARSLLSFFSFFWTSGTGALPPGPIQTRVRRKPRPEPEVPLHRALDSEFKSPNCKQFEPSEPREKSQAQQTHTLPPKQKPQKKPGGTTLGPPPPPPGRERPRDRAP